jgi:tetratricopeptide (TPR) repeat protein
MALQSHFSGNPQLGEELFTLSTANVEPDDQPGVTVAGVQYLRLTGRNEAALRYLRAFLDDPQMARQSGYWRLYAAVAQQQGSSAESLEGLEHAIDLEYADLAGVVNLATVRHDHGMLFMEFTRVADASRALGVSSPEGFVRRVIRAADRWRALDTDDTAACRAATAVLERLGETQLAWDYLTTPLAEHPNEAAPWSGVAAQLAQQGDLEFAARCYETAYAIEDGNAQILFDLARVRQQQGRTADAQDVLRRITTGTWQPRFEWIKRQASQMLSK